MASSFKMCLPGFSKRENEEERNKHNYFIISFFYRNGKHDNNKPEESGDQKK